MLFHEAKLRAQGKIPGNLPIYFFPTLNSTNTFLLDKVGARQSAFCLAETQTKGRGQYGRSWVSPAAQNIYLSYLTYQKTPLQQIQDISIQVGEILYDYLSQGLNIPQLHLKWPNDILFEQKHKLAGILVETKKHQDLSALVIGIGLNVNMQELPQVIDQPWISLTKITGKTYNLNSVAGNLMQKLLTAFPACTI
jgi:BirA family transcriptional regulator, biotin operon repressor / biotin---[acetyl-CoA-carboxylase] ligase